MTLRPCLTCGRLTPSGSYCPKHQPLKRPSPSSSNRPSPHARKRVKERDGGRCQACGSTVGLRVHHRQQVAEGGSHDPSNLVTLCVIWHAAVHRQ